MKSNFYHIQIIFVCVFVFLSSCTAFPVQLDHGSSDGQTKDWRTVMGALVAAALIICVVVMTVQCLCCDVKPRRASVTRQDRTPASTTVRENGALSTEFTIFPPVGSQQLVDLRNDDDVKFEPLPDIHPRRQNSVSSNQKPRPATFSNVVTKGLSLRDWFEDPHSNFPRKQLQYVRELGSGWFGQVVEGEAYGIIPTQRKTKVVVKILMEGANTTDQMYFLHEVKPFRDLSHPNVLKLLGKCLESDPFLIILENCAFKDLKSYLVHHRTEAESLFNQNLLLRMVCNVAAGLLHVHEHGFVLTDLAARNCVVSADLIVKIGDYGNSIELYKDDYYCAGGIAVPVRWCAPETLRCTETIMETREVTREANIWSFGVVLWEILEFGKLPYIELSDDELIQKVIIDRTEMLRRPLTPYSHVNRLYQIIQLCQLSPTNRPSMEKIHAMLSYLYSYKMESPDSAAEFEARWNQLQPRRPPAKSASSPPAGSHVIDLGSPMCSDGESLHMCEMSSSPHPSLSYDSDFGQPIIISPSLQNLRGSIDDLRIDEDSRKNGFVSQDLIAVSTESFNAENSSVLNPGEPDSRTESALSFHKAEIPSSSASLLELSSKALDERSSSSKEVSPFTREVQEVIRKLDEDLDRECPSLADGVQMPVDASIEPVAVSEDTRMDSSMFGDESYLNSIGSEVDYDSLSHDVSGIVVDRLEEVKENSDDDDDELSWRKIVETNNEQSGEITRIIREKSQSVQDFLKLTVIDSESGSDSDGVPNSKNESASSGEGDCSPKVLRRQFQVRRRQSADDILLDVRGEEGRGASGRAVFANIGDGLTHVHAVTGLLPGSSLDPVHVDAILPPSSVRNNNNSHIACTDTGDAAQPRPLDRLADDLVTDLLLRALPEVVSAVSPIHTQNTASCTNPSDLPLDNSRIFCCSSASSLTAAISQPISNTHSHVPHIVVDEAGDEENDCVEETITYRPKFGLNFRFVFKSLDDCASVQGSSKKVMQVESASADNLETSESVTVNPDTSFSLLDDQPLPSERTSTPHSKSSNEDSPPSANSYNFESDAFILDYGMQVVPSDGSASSQVQYDCVKNFAPDVQTASTVDVVPLGINSVAQNETLLSLADDRGSNLGKPVLSLVSLSEHSPPSTKIAEDCIALNFSGSLLIPEHDENLQADDQKLTKLECGATVSNSECGSPDVLLSGDISEPSDLRTAAADQLLLTDNSCLSTIKQSSLFADDGFPLGSFSEEQQWPATNNDDKLIDFDICSDECPAVIGQFGANSEAKDMPKLIDEIQTILSPESPHTDSSIPDQIPLANADVAVRDVECLANRSLVEPFLPERQPLSTPDIIIDSAFAYLNAVDEPDLVSDSLNGNLLMDSIDLPGDFPSEDCGAAGNCCPSPSPGKSIQNDPNGFLCGISNETQMTEETDADQISLDEGFEPSESSENSRTMRTETDSSSSHPELLAACSGQTAEAGYLLQNKNATADDSHLLDSSSSLYSADEDCIMLVDLETNEVVLVDQPKSKLAFAQNALEKCPGDPDSAGCLSTLSVSPTLFKNGSSSVSSMKETSASVEPEEICLGEDCCEGLVASSQYEEPNDDSVSCDTTQTSNSSGSEPSLSECTSEASSSSSSPSKLSDSDTSVASDWQFLPQESQSTVQVVNENNSVPDEKEANPINFARFKVQKMDPQTTDALSLEATPDLLFLMQLTAKMEKLGLNSDGEPTEQTSSEVTISSDKNLPTDNEKCNSKEEPNGCIPPTSSPVNGRAIPNDRLLSPQWETSTDSSSSPSGCHSPSSASSTSGEFDCSKDFKFEIYKVQEVAGAGDDDEDDADADDEEENQADDEGGYGDDEGEEDEDSLIDSFKASTWNKDATPTKGLLRSPDKQYHSEGKKTVSFKLQKRSVIYEYPKEEVEEEEPYDRQEGHSVWTYHMYNPELDYSRYADWDLEEVVPDNVEIEEFDDDGSSESSSDFMAQQKHPDQAQALYKLSDIPDEDLASDYSSEGGPGGSASYYGHHDSFDFASYLNHYNGSPFYASVPSENQDDEDFWLETILNSGDFFVSGSDCPFDFDAEGGEGGEGLPQWALTPGTFNMYVDMQDGSEHLNGSSHRYEMGTSHNGEDDEEEEDEDGEHVQYEREGHISRMGEYREVDDEDEEEEQLEGAEDNGDVAWDDVESGESAESDLLVAMETDSTDDNLDEVKADKKVKNLINNNLLSSVGSNVAKTNAETKSSAVQINGNESRLREEVSTADWKSSSGKSSEDNIINRGSSQLETAA